MSQTTFQELLTRMEATPLKKRNIGQFCAGYIYHGKCITQADCNRNKRMHTDNIDFIKEYLEDGKIKSVLCENAAHCRNFLCRWGHDYDYIIFGHSDTTDENADPDTTVYDFSLQERDNARQAWKDAKHEAYCQELYDGSRQPKNERERNMLIEMQQNQANVEMHQIIEQSIPVSIYPDTPPIICNIQPQTIYPVDPVPMGYDISAHFSVIANHINMHPSNYFADPVIYQLFQLACRQHNIINQ